MLRLFSLAVLPPNSMAPNATPKSVTCHFNSSICACFRAFHQDLDINVSSLGFTTFLPNEFVCHPRTVDTRQHITWANTVKCDVATERTELVNDAFETYSCVTEDGIRYASANILLADKIRTYGQRPFQAVQKQHNDLDDVLQLIDVMRQKGDKMPGELKESILSEDVLRAFLERVPIEDHLVYRTFLEELDVILPN